MGFIGVQPATVPLTSSDITDGIISTAKIADTAVSTAKIADDAVGNTKLDLTANYAFTGTITGAGDLSVGVSQTWTDVTSSRAVGTVYTNSTGRPIFCVFIGTTGTSAGCNWEVGGVAGSQQVYTNSSNGRSEISAIVPNGVTYEVNGNATKQTWIELR